MNAITVPEKIYGHEQNPQYDSVPLKFHSKVLEERIFMSGENKKRPRTAKKKLGRGGIIAQNKSKKLANFEKDSHVSPYSNPGERPQHSKAHKVSKSIVMSRLASDNPSLIQALVPKKKQSVFMKQANKPLIQAQLKEDLLNCFMALIDQERMIEQTKIALAGHADFNIFDCFRVFDHLGRGCLTMAELYNGLVNKLGLVPNQDELELFFMRYDRDRDGRLRFTEFADAFVPLDPHYAQILNQR